MELHTNGKAPSVGQMHGRVTRDLGELGTEKIGLAWRLQNLFKRRRELPQEIALAVLGRVQGVITLRSALVGSVYRPRLAALAPWQVLKLNELLRAGFPLCDLPRHFGGLCTDYGIMSRQMVTDTGVGYIVDAFQNIVELESMCYHAFGTGAGAEAVGNTALTTEITTNHYTTSVRPTGTTIEGVSANIFKTVATHTQATAGDSITEHGVLSSATPGAGVLLDKHLFAAVALAVADSFQTTYQLTLASGG